MTGIPVYTQAPINAAKASGTTPQTTAPPSQTASGPNQASTTTAATSSYPPAQPGAAPFPAPTAAAQQRYAPVQPTPTTKDEADLPAPPQPGAVPTPLGTSSIPPPPKAGETYKPPQQTAAPTQPLAQPYPSQMSIPPLTGTYGAQPPHSSTATTTTPSGSYPASIPEVGARRSLEHPPGYQQNVYASEMTSDQRRAQEAANYSSTAHDNKETIAGIGTENVWSTAKKWLGQAGEKLSEAEAEVWRQLRKE
ncbi:uncharacterized protein LY89DRAFT_681644 [Mollisia scopiformis]|uniref:Uncharacterized protein n=1 Tax=Mollisia scopiformis TaxID=149040 RepID=A0A194XLF9_MOLSC|nr:uncharacterized protein LY89DRAFT_681644 [Mollisia scopiformis]KUJ21013.1 hypothetical protein LY89DRAFT_681644 [Mollisia scopiformis]